MSSYAVVQRVHDITVLRLRVPAHLGKIRGLAPKATR